MRGSRVVLIAVSVALACGRISYGPSGTDRDGAVDDGDGGDLQADARTSLEDAVNIVFVSSKTIVPGELGSVQAADLWCTELAVGAGHSGDYVAWLSSSSSNVASRIGAARSWMRPDGLMVADQIEQLAAGELWHTINLDETGARTEDVVATASAADGTLSLSEPIGPILGTATCDDYTQTVHESGLAAGTTRRSGTGFSRATLVTCDAASRVYCFGVSNSRAVSLAPATGRLAFLSTSTWIPGGGISTADAVCLADATAADLSGTYRALIAGSSASAASRFSLLGPSWVRVDGAQLAPTPTAFMDGALDAGLRITATGQLVDGVGAWTGYPADALYTANDLGPATCNDWNVTGGSAGRGNPEVAATGMFHGGTGPCSQPAHVYCLQE